MRRIIDLGTLGGTLSAANAINDSSLIAGESMIAGDSTWRAVAWTAEDGLINLGTLGGTYSTAFGVNNTGQTSGGVSPNTIRDPTRSSGLEPMG